MSSSTRQKRKRKGGRKEQDDEPNHLAPKVTSGILEFHHEAVRGHITCSVCKGYLRCACTISECLHSFCKSCLFLVYNRGATKCPECDVVLGPDPYSVTMYDRTLQELVDKILPDMQDIEDADEREFYEMKGIKPKQKYVQVIENERKKAEAKGNLEDGVGDVDNTSKAHEKQSSKPQRSGASSSTKEAESIPTDELNIELCPHEERNENSPKRKRSRLMKGIEPLETSIENSLPALKDSLIRTSGRLKVSQLKKYLIGKLELAAPNSTKLEIRCNGDAVGDELSLTFIQRTRWHLPFEDMVLTYRIAEESIFHQRSQVIL